MHKHTLTGRGSGKTLARGLVGREILADCSKSSLGLGGIFLSRIPVLLSRLQSATLAAHFRAFNPVSNPSDFSPALR